jgi:hypothetical protein
MKKAFLRYGLLSALFMTVFFLIDDIILHDYLNFQVREIVGWVGIFLSTLFIYFGIKYYRDRLNNGVVSFGEALKLGLLILVLPSLAFGIFNVIYVMANPEFLNTYYEVKLAEARALPPAEVQAAIAEVEKGREMFGNPGVQFLFMFLSVFAVGLIVTVISALILRRKGSVRVQTA